MPEVTSEKHQVHYLTISHEHYRIVSTVQGTRLEKRVSNWWDVSRLGEGGGALASGPSACDKPQNSGRLSTVLLGRELPQVRAARTKCVKT